MTAQRRRNGANCQIRLIQARKSTHGQFAGRRGRDGMPGFYPVLYERSTEAVVVPCCAYIPDSSVIRQSSACSYHEFSVRMPARVFLANRRRYNRTGRVPFPGCSLYSRGASSEAIKFEAAGNPIAHCPELSGRREAKKATLIKAEDLLESSGALGSFSLRAHPARVGTSEP